MMDAQAQDLPRRGRPDDIRRALLQAAVALNTPAGHPTLRELLRQARVGVTSGGNAVKNMRRCGLLVVVGERRVNYRNRPVAEYAAACPVSVQLPRVVENDFAALSAAWS